MDDHRAVLRGDPRQPRSEDGQLGVSRASAPILLRRAGPGDAAAIGALTREAYAKWVPVIGREPKPITVDYARAVAAHRFDLLLVGETLAGLLETVVAPEAPLIENVAVAPAWQGRGFGRRLLSHAEALAAEARVPRVRLYTTRRFEANIRLYHRIGYSVTHEESNELGVAVHMSKAVTPG